MSYIFDFYFTSNILCYLMVSANYVKERCVSAVVRNVGHDKFKPLTQASDKMKTLTEGLSEKASQAKHFDESKTALKVKRGFNIDKSGRYSLQDVFRLHEIINAKAAEMDKIAEEMRNFRSETNNVKNKKSSGLKVISEVQDDPCSTESVCDTLMSGLSAEVQFELDLKTRIMQAEIVLEKARDKLLLVEAMNPMKSSMKI